MQIIPVDRFWSVEPTAFAQLAEIVGRMDLGALVVEARAHREPESLLSQIDGPVDNVGIINVRGTITKHPSLFHSLFGGNASTLAIGEALRTAMSDESIDSIMLRVDSPGGSVEGVADLADAIFQASKKKLIVAQIDGIGASGAYWLASQATKVFMGATDQVGSIGVRATFYDYSEAFAKEGVEAVVIDTGKFKSAGEHGTEITEEHKAYFQSLVDAYFDAFSGAVVRGRTLSQEAFDEVAEGKVYIGAAGVANGLVDGIQSVSDTLGLMLRGEIAHETEHTARVRTAQTRHKATKTLKGALA